MMYEIIGSRVLAPFIGTSTYVWTSLIGVILGALSLGYWLGGRIADRRPDAKVLSFVIFLAGGFVSATVLVKDILLSFIASASTGLEIKSLLAALLLFAPASVLLGFVTPYAVRLEMPNTADSGKTVGRLFAYSTVGSIVGTFAAGFVLIPFVGSIRTLYMIAGGLILLSLLLAPLALKRTNIGIILLFLLAIAGNEFVVAVEKTNGVYDIDTEYSRMRVYRTTDPKNGREITALATDPFFTQSAIYSDSDEPVLDYGRFYALAGYFKPGPIKALMIGGAGYTFPREFLRDNPQAAIDVVEIDPRMTDIARRFFRLTDDARMTVIHKDGREFLNQAESEKYDVVFIDAFNSLFSVPFQLTTREAVRQIDRVLKPDGLVLFNIGSCISGPGSGFLQAEYRTYQETFPNIHLFKVHPDFADKRLQNVVMLAGKTTLPVDQPAPNPTIAGLLAHRYSSDLPLTRPVLTDDLAPVERYGSIAFAFYSR
jgi:spermidine synthase